MRNAIVHGYWKVDLEVVWRAIENDLPDMEHQLEIVLNGQHNVKER